MVHHEAVPLNESPQPWLTSQVCAPANPAYAWHTIPTTNVTAICVDFMLYLQ
jgi:hypothetical protein